MTVRLVPPRDPRKIPEYILWALMKDTRTAEARIRMTPIGPELRFFVSRLDGRLDLLWSMIYKDGEGGNLGDDAELKRREFEVRGWTAPSAPQFGGCHTASGSTPRAAQTEPTIAGPSGSSSS